jgi:hypothetical protein
MRNSFLRSFIIIATFIDCCLASPTPPTLDVNQNLTLLNNVNVNITSLSTDFQCYEPHIFTDRRAKTLDCIRAAASFPNFYDVNTFHKGSNPSDPYAVPISQVSGTCRVGIDLKYGRADQSTWLSIKMALRFDIIDNCQLDMSGGRTGGQTTAGSGGRIIITAESVKWPQSNTALAKRLGS